MLTILAYIAVTVTVLAIGVLILAAFQPNTFRIARSTQIAASPEKLHGLIDDLRAMNTWNPFALRAIAPPGTYSNPSDGVGATYAFDCPKTGTGLITVLDSTPRQIAMRLNMSKPFKADNTITFDLKPVGTSTDVTWAMSGASPLIGRVISLFINCDKMMGRDFEQGLANLKSIAERQ